MFVWVLFALCIFCILLSLVEFLEEDDGCVIAECGSVEDRLGDEAYAFGVAVAM